jgi:hypothetical protein
MTFPEKLLLAPRNKTGKLAKSSEATVQRNSTEDYSSKGLHKLEDFFRPRENQLCQTPKSNQSREILKRDSNTYALMFKPSRLLAKGKLMSLARPLFKQRQYHFPWYLTSA